MNGNALICYDLIVKDKSTLKNSQNESKKVWKKLRLRMNSNPFE